MLKCYIHVSFSLYSKSLVQFGFGVTVWGQITQICTCFPAHLMYTSANVK